MQSLDIRLLQKALDSLFLTIEGLEYEQHD